MSDTLLDLHGKAHRERRRIENRLFRREIFSYWEHEVLGKTIDVTLNPFVQSKQGDLSVIGYRCAMNLTATIAGIDQDPSDTKQTETLYGIVKKFSEGATLLHSTRNKECGSRDSPNRCRKDRETPRRLRLHMLQLSVVGVQVFLRQASERKPRQTCLVNRWFFVVARLLWSRLPLKH